LPVAVCVGLFAGNFFRRILAFAFVFLAHF
jgi:hypothetical protein